jgi:hypothetical protein
LILRANTYRPETYAQRRVAEMLEETGDARAIDEEVARWCDYYRQAGVRAIHGGLIALRQRDGTNWVRIEEKMATAMDPYGDLVRDAFRNADFVRAESSDSALAAARLTLGPHVLLLQKSEAAGGDWIPTESIIQSSRGWQSPFTLDHDFAHLLPQFDGAHTVAELGTIFAEYKGADADAVQGQFCRVVRQLLQLGVLRAPQLPRGTNRGEAD